MSTLLTLLFQWCSLLSLISSTINVSAKIHGMPRLGMFGGKYLQERGKEAQTLAKKAKDSKEFRTFFYTQTLDHFNYRPQSYTTFKQKYVINSKHWGGAKKNAPIFVYLGEESPLEEVPDSGFLHDNAHRFKALLIYIEHRFYGKSVPLRSFEKAMKNVTLRGYFNSAQALADYAEIILYVKEKFHTHYSPVIVFGGSYGGMLATWFRLHYPHIALGALASSAPILYFDDIIPQNMYHSIVTKDFREASESCYQTIKNLWSEIDKVASQSNGVLILSQKFKTCKPLNGSRLLKDYLEGHYMNAAQYNGPPTYPVTKICQAIDGAPKGTDILGRIFAGLVAYKGKNSCYDMTPTPSQTEVGYDWQTCSEMVMPFGSDDMFPNRQFNLSDFTKECINTFGVPPRPHWVTTYYGGHDIKLVLQKFASNIIFSNGLRDPYSGAGVLEDISDTILAVHTANGSHCLDLLGANKKDPYWLVEQRQREAEIIKGWIKKYNVDLSSMKKK
ncbi:uncharacterized protein LOC132281573 [Cornus florida]|uniref:uncharacterized protein LOC132281573 n=1 Tax=Cornus florida TaxID=4283 RepID=UPI00289A7EC4|nr:uncharacterized protein LOC132281573 [Cornus florida]